MLKELVFLRVGPYRLFVGWDTDPVAATKPMWYGDGLQFGRLRADWGKEREGYAQYGEVDDPCDPERDRGANAPTREAA